MPTSNDFIMHYGTKGQKWGVRRYQNDDGTLTALGKERYAGETNYASDGPGEGAIRSLAKSSWTGRKTLSREWAKYADKKSKEYSVLAKEAKARGDERAAAKYEKKSKKKAERAEAQKAANANRKAYEDHTSTGKLVLQDYMLTKHGAQNYRAARARGAGRLRSLLETTAGVGIVGTALAASGNKKKYGKRVVLSEPKSITDYYGNAMINDD